MKELLHFALIVYWTTKETWHFYLLQTQQIRDLSFYTYVNNKTLESILRKIYLSFIEHDVTKSKIPFLTLLPR